MEKEFDLDGIVPWGRTFDEYCAFFALSDIASLRSGAVLDAGGGPSSFVAQATKLGIDATAVDPIYGIDGAQIRARFEAICPAMLQGMIRASYRFVWSYYSSPDDVMSRRRRALDDFLLHYEAGKESGRYVRGQLPFLPFATGQFSLALCSHLLFLYSDELDEEFHVASLLELLRVANEARVFPLISLDGQRSPHVEATMEALTRRAFRCEIVAVPFEFQCGAHEMLRAWRS